MTNLRKIQKEKSFELKKNQNIWGMVLGFWGVGEGGWLRLFGEFDMNLQSVLVDLKMFSLQKGHLTLVGKTHELLPTTSSIFMSCNSR